MLCLLKLIDVISRTFFLTLIFISEQLVAQTNMGSFMIGGNAYFSISETENYNSEVKLSSTSFSPQLGYFVFDNFAVGLAMPIGFHKYKTTYDVQQDPITYETKNNSLGIGPFLRYYVPLGKIFLFAEGSYSFSKSSGTILSFDPQSGGLIERDNITKNQTFWIGPGIAMMVNKHIGIEGLLSYKNTSINNNNNPFAKSDQQGIFFELGLQYYIPKSQ